MAVLAAVALVLGPAEPAFAHSVSGVGATNFRTTLSALAPAQPGISAAVVENGSRLQVVNTTGDEVTVRGYTGEPYARIGKDGVFLNDNSPATYVNADRYGTATVPTGVDPAAAPVWRKVSDQNVYRWHDHRIHWMLSTLPAPVADDPTTAHRISNWTIQIDYRGQVLTATGSLDWIPGPSPQPWIWLTVVIGLIVATAPFLRRTGFTIMAAATASMIATDVLHSAGIAAAEVGTLPERLGALFGADFTAMLVWPFAIVAAWRLAAARSSFWVMIAAVAGMILGFTMVMEDAPIWWRSSAPSGLSMTLNRATVSIVIGAGAGLVLAAAITWGRAHLKASRDLAAADQARLAAVLAAVPISDTDQASDSDQLGTADGKAQKPDSVPDASETPPDDRAEDADAAPEPAGVGRRSVAGYLAAAGAGALAGVGIGVSLRPDTATTVAQTTGAPLMTDIGAGRVAFYGTRQAGVDVPVRGQAHGWVAAFDLGPAADTAGVKGLLRRWTEAAAQLAEGKGVGAPDDHIVTGSGPSSLTITFGFGPTLFGKAGIPLAARPAALAPLPVFAGERLDPAASDGDLAVIIRADDPMVVFHAARVMQRLATPTSRLRWQQTGFAATPGAAAPDATGRNLMGQIDGTNNPTPADPGYDTKIFVTGAGEPGWLRGGSYLVVRRIRMRLGEWDQTTTGQQEQAIGRKKDTGAPLSGGDEHTPPNFGALGPDGNPLIPVTAHIRQAAPAFNHGAAILRRGLSYTDGHAAGLLFMAFQADPRTGFIPIQQRLAANDALAAFIVHETSALFAIPAGVVLGGYVGQDLFGKEQA